MSKIALEGNASGTGTLSIVAPSTSTDRTLTLPDASGTVLTSASDIDTQVASSLNASGSAPIYACRAWVNFNGTGTVAIRASGNVTSITDNGTGDYTVNFTTAMPDANYSVTAMGQRNDFDNGDFNVSCAGNTSGDWSTTSVSVATAHASTFTLSDARTVALAIFR